MFKSLKFIIEETKQRRIEQQEYKAEDERLLLEQKGRLDEAITAEMIKLEKEKERAEKSILNKINPIKKDFDKKEKKRIEKLKEKLEKEFARERKDIEEQRKQERAERDAKCQKILSIYAGIIVVIVLIVTVTIGSINEKKQDYDNDASNEEISEIQTDQSNDKSVASDNIVKQEKKKHIESSKEEMTLDLQAVPSYSDKAYVEINNNQPYFKDEELVTTAFEEYSDLDDKGRCGIAYANISKEIMPTEKRTGIGQIKPSGWHTVKYPDIISDLYLYNRCHLIAFCLAGENVNEKNLITGTRYMNIEGMLPFEEKVAAYVEQTNNHVLYRVTPIFEGENLVASGVLMEAKSVEDNGTGICYNVYCYNVQPGIIINYATGESSVDSNYKASRETPSGDSNTTSSNNRPNKQSGSESNAVAPNPVPTSTPEPEPQSSTSMSMTYIVNVNSGKFHYPGCRDVNRMSDSNKMTITTTREDLRNQGYEPCGHCKP